MGDLKAYHKTASQIDTPLHMYSVLLKATSFTCISMMVAAQSLSGLVALLPILVGFQIT